MKLAIVTYIYPKAIPFFDDFLIAVNEQDYSDFDLLIFNDGVTNPHTYFCNLEKSFKIIDIKDASISGIRYQSFALLKSMEYDYLIFHDIDDLMTPNRVGCLQSKLADHDIVCNDITIKSNGELQDENIWSDRLSDNFEFDSEFLIDKNILGLGNSAIRRKVLEYELYKDKCIIATDWYVFYQWLYSNDIKALFTNQCATIYNQHEGNVAGITNRITYDKLKSAISIKKEHFRSLSHINPKLCFEFEQTLKLEKELYKFSNINIQLDKFPFWWEETKMI